MQSNLTTWHVANATGIIIARLHLLCPWNVCVPNLQMKKVNLWNVECFQTSLRSEGNFLFLYDFCFILPLGE